MQKPVFPDPANTADLVSFLSGVRAAWDRQISQVTVEDVVFKPLLEGGESMNFFHEAGHPWSTRAIVFQDRGTRVASWNVTYILNRYKVGRSTIFGPSVRIIA